MRLSFPQFIFGSSDGIDWIKQNGEYNKNIFQNKKYDSYARKTILDIINKDISSIN